MKRIASFLLAALLLITALPMTVHAAAPVVMEEEEDMVLDYGASADNGAVELMSTGSRLLYELADIPEGGTYQPMDASQKIIDVIKDFEGFRSTPYWDNSQWTVGYGTRCSGPNVTVTRAEAERLLKKMIDNDFEPVVNNFCKKNGKQPTQQQFDALLDLTFNAGGSWSTGSAVPDVLLNPTTALDVVKGFGAWSRSGGKVSYVHVNRRIREALIYLYGEYYLAYGGQDCQSGLKIVNDDKLPHFKTVIFKTKAGTLENGKTDYAGYYPVGSYYTSFITAKRSGYTLVGWEITKRSNDSVSGGERISIWDKVEENVELTAVWEKGTFVVAPEPPPADYMEPGDETLPFTDVPENSWFYDAVSYVYRNQYMNGMSATDFVPGGSMTRGMLVTVLYRIDGSVPVSDEERACFDDIGGAYYTDAVAWAFSNDIVNGVGGGSFAPDRVVTRQEAVTIFHRYCVGQEQSGVGANTALDGFVDKDHVVEYAVDAFNWAVQTGFVEGSIGVEGFYLNPNESLNRAQAAVLLQRCVEDIM